MLRILTGTFRNFLTIGQIEQSVDLAIDGLTLVLGENLDVGGANSRNGAGKTSILQAISYGLFGKPLTKIRLDNLCNNVNGKGMLVTLDFEVHGKRYRIERGRKPAVLRFYQDGVHQQAFDEAQGESRHTQAEIDRILGMSHTLFRHIVALNTSTMPFLREEPSVQREVIEELFGIDQLSQRAEALKDRIDLTKEQVRSTEAKVTANTEANARITKAIERAKSDAEAWRVTQRHRLVELVEAADTLDGINIDQEIAVFDAIDQWERRQREIDGQREHAERQLSSYTQEIARLQRDVTRYEAAAQHVETGEIDRLDQQAQSYLAEAQQDIQPQLARLRAEVVRQRQQAADTREAAQRVVGELVETDRQLASPNEHVCGTCGQRLVGTDHLAIVIANLTAQREQLASKNEQLVADQTRMLRHAEEVAAEIVQREQADQARRAQLREKAAALQLQIEQAKVERAAERERVRAEIANLRSTLDAAEVHRQQQIAHIALLPKLGPRPTSSYADREAVWQVRQQRDLLLSQITAEQAKPNPHEVKIEGLRATLVEIDYVTLNDLILRQKHETFLHKLLTSKDSFIRKRVIDQNLSYLNKRLDHYLQRLGLPHEVIFQPDLTVEIMLLGRSFDFEQLSRGEMNRVILATSWAFRDVYENLNDTLNLLLVDEMLDQGTDGAGVEAALDILAGMATERHKSVFLISHRDELRDRIDHVLTVRKENQFTVFG